jgi:hypothetical protein
VLDDMFEAGGDGGGIESIDFLLRAGYYY